MQFNIHNRGLLLREGWRKPLFTNSMLDPAKFYRPILKDRSLKMATSFFVYLARLCFKVSSVISHPTFAPVNYIDQCQCIDANLHRVL